MIMPCRRLSKGSAASSTASSVAAAPEARKPEPIHSIRWSPVTLSPATTRTRRQRPARIQSSARATPWVVLAHAELIWVLGPRAPMISANWEWPIDSTRKQEPAVEGVGLGLQILADCPDALVDLPRHRVAVADARAQRQQQIQRLPPGPVDVVALELVGEAARSPGRPRRRRCRCRRASSPAASTGRAAGCRCWSSCSAGRAGCRRRAARRSRRRPRAA